MARGFFVESPSGNGYRTSIRNIRVSREFFRANPDGSIPTGMWDTPTWDAKSFTRWLRACLDAKINATVPMVGRRFGDDYQAGLKRDARIINEYHNRRRHSGCRNLLNTKELKARYPHVDNQPHF